MKRFTFENQWDAIKGQLKQRFAQLTDEDLAFVAGKGEELLARLREKLGISADDLTALLEELRARVGAAVDDVKAKGAAVAGVARDEARRRVRTLRDDGEEYIRQNPRESLVAAVCAGFVAGLLIRR